MADYESLIPVNLLTGFLGSGKTTLLRRFLASPGFANTAVLINEFGEVGLDHLLLERIDGETVVLQSGCVCCTIRSDLKEALSALFDKRQRGLIPAFDRVVIETTGLADPAPIVFTLMGDPVVRHHFRLGNVITTVDAVNGRLHLDDNPESTKQVAVADRIVLTKTDLSGRVEASSLRRQLVAINGAAAFYDAVDDALDASILLASDVYDPATKSVEVRQWLEQEAAAHDHGAVDVNRHARGIQTFHVTIDRPLDWTAFGLWLSMLLHAHGDRVLRVKGLLDVVGLTNPVVIHGVQHVVHPPVHLEAWPTADKRSRIVFIVRDMERAIIERSLKAFNRLGNPPGVTAA